MRYCLKCIPAEIQRNLPFTEVFVLYYCLIKRFKRFVRQICVRHSACVPARGPRARNDEAEDAAGLSPDKDDNEVWRKSGRKELRQYRIIPGTHLACIIFRHIARKPWLIQQVFPAVFRRSDENSDCAICAPELCGIALNVLLDNKF